LGWRKLQANFGNQRKTTKSSILFGGQRKNRWKCYNFRRLQKKKLPNIRGPPKMLEIKPAVRLSLNQFLSSLLSVHGRAATTTHLPCHHLPAHALPPACSRHHCRCLLRSSLLRQCVICRCPVLSSHTVHRGASPGHHSPRPPLLWPPPTAGSVGPAVEAPAPLATAHSRFGRACRTRAGRPLSTTGQPLSSAGLLTRL
jgi:hypothetical protein